MKINKIYIPLVVVFIISIILLIWLIQQNKPLYDQIEKVISESDSGYSELIHIHTDRERTMAFYINNRSELGVVLLKKKIRGYELSEYMKISPMFTDQVLSWHGSENQKFNIHMLYGVVKDPEITQILLISEGDKTAQIINNGEYSIWYSFVENGLKMPITIRATNKKGEILYETGDVGFFGID
ncbi:hypothetical protein ASG89_18155 [Paenibacillus sp. Soil766]|uniref:hypothetical protein n=1 Tax=Paenibacillus sp. Soil766 TaxID=1736404 RepID=UPI000710B357|nr:hypothetical protein [Paenibacillus sp. Soil766]KRF06782.1 hypothetical protein ASG89_18155 [Paenibacillus sp. Soil766]